MSTGKYFRFIGIFVIICWIIGLIFYLVSMFFAFFGSSSVKGLVIFGYIMGLIAIIVFGPAVGALFISYGNHLIDSQPIENEEHLDDEMNGDFCVGDTVELKYSQPVSLNDSREITAHSIGKVDGFDLSYVTVIFEIDWELVNVKVNRDNLKRINNRDF